MTEPNLSNLYAVTPEPGCGPDKPMRAAAWFWQVGDRWMAVTEYEDENDWFESDLSGAPTPRTYPITQVPPFGTLCFRLADGRVVEGTMPDYEQKEVE